METRTRSVGNIALALLILTGILINFLPTINYYLRIYPKLKDNIFSNKIFLKYRMKLIFALVNITNITKSKSSIVFIINNSTLTIRPINRTVLDYTLRANVVESFPYNGSNLNREFVSKGFIFRDSPLGRLLLLQNNGTNVINILNISIELRRIPPNVVNFNAMLSPAFYLKPIPYHGEYEGRCCSIYLTYWELENNYLLLATYVYSRNIPPINDVVLQIINMIFKHNSIINIIRSNTDKMRGVHLVMSLSDANVRLKNDILGRILFDFTVTYFPINIALIASGLVGVILLQRGKVR